MGLWDDIKRFFGAGDGDGTRALETAVRAQMLERMERGHTFSAVNIADALALHGSKVSAVEVASCCEVIYARGEVGRNGYTRSQVTAGARAVWVYHPLGQAPAASSQPPPAGPSAGEPSIGGPPPKTKAKRGEKRPDPYDAGGLMSLSPAELRARALNIQPWRTAWIGRVDVIPPASDERTALVDRGLVLRGFFTEEEIAEIHRIGDLWLEHRDAARLAKAKAAKDADEAIAQLRRQAAERKAKKRAEAAERKRKHAEAVARRKATDIIFLGRGVSGRLHDRRADVEALEAAGLPVLASPADVAEALELPVPKLRWLAFHAEASEQGHYVQFEVPKRRGGTRLLSAPKRELRAAQRWILEAILTKVPLEPAAHGFVPGRSTVTSARAHVGRHVVVNLDLEDFFPTITFPRVRGLFASLGYSPAAATVLALLTTEAPRRDVTYDGTRYRVAVGPRALPQGACTSPALSNLVARKLDRRLTGLSTKHGWTYTRYADDLTFSHPGEGNIGHLIASVRHVVGEEGFAINEEKGRVQRAGGRQTVTGIVVNERLSVPREERRRLRAILHNAKKTGLAAQNVDGHADFEAHLRGLIAYVAMIDPERGARFAAQLDALTE
ncbi:MAG TPA: reverse transcriptase family protein [Sandaracinaceae bacterium LLY-WYZ-13_1]|nr:reverse transcriptase family protein [Sandaracinaceae bacterium LLY-WYZ-13_1]